jgi:hypothetical protein
MTLDLMILSLNLFSLDSLLPYWRPVLWLLDSSDHLCGHPIRLLLELISRRTNRQFGLNRDPRHLVVRHNFGPVRVHLKDRRRSGGRRQEGNLPETVLQGAGLGRGREGAERS